MVAMEIFRLHHRHLDIRNAYTTLKRLTERYPNLPMLVSRLGRFCLEIGRKVEALSHFQIIQDMIQRRRNKSPDLLQDKSDDTMDPLGDKEDDTSALDDLLGGQPQKPTTGS